MDSITNSIQSRVCTSNQNKSSATLNTVFASRKTTTTSRSDNPVWQSLEEKFCPRLKREMKTSNQVLQVAICSLNLRLDHHKSCFNKFPTCKHSIWRTILPWRCPERLPPITTDKTSTCESSSTMMWTTIFVKSKINFLQKVAWIDTLRCRERSEQEWSTGWLKFSPISSAMIFLSSLLSTWWTGSSRAHLMNSKCKTYILLE